MVVVLQPQITVVELQPPAGGTVTLGPSSSGVEVVLSPNQGLRGPSGPPGDGGVAEKYVHTQSAPATEWIVNHNFGQRPQIDVFTVGWLQIEAEILHVTVNQAVIYLNSAQSGFAICQ